MMGEVFPPAVPFGLQQRQRPPGGGSAPKSASMEPFKRRKSAEGGMSSSDNPFGGEGSGSLLSRSLGNVGGPSSEILRRSSECSSITHSGYLFKRSNKPFRATTTAAGGGPSPAGSRPGSRPLSPAAIPSETSGVSSGASATASERAAAVAANGADQAEAAAAGALMGPQHLFRAESSLSTKEDEAKKAVGEGDEPADVAIEIAAGFFGYDSHVEAEADGGKGRCWPFRGGRTKSAAAAAVATEARGEFDGVGATPPRSNSTPLLAAAAVRRIVPPPLAQPLSSSRPIPISGGGGGGGGPSSLPPADAARGPLVGATLAGGRIAIPVAQQHQQQGVPLHQRSYGSNSVFPPHLPDHSSFHRFDSAPAAVAGGESSSSSADHSSSGHQGHPVHPYFGNGVRGVGTAAADARGYDSGGSSNGNNARRTSSDEFDSSCHSGGLHGPPPPDFIDPTDGHIWRAKYCILEDGVLYFYRNAVVGESMEAQVEREQMSMFHSLPPETRGAAMGAMGMGAGNGGGGAAAGGRDSPDLSRSPVAGGAHPLLAAALRTGGAAESSFCVDSRVIFEKRVALDCVGEVRSAELDYGERSFELLAIEAAEDGAKDEKEEDEESSSSDDDDDETQSESESEVEELLSDEMGESITLKPKPKKPKKQKSRTQGRLILRASSTDEMNEWLFQFHRSLASFMKEIVDLVGSVALDADKMKAEAMMELAAEIETMQGVGMHQSADFSQFGQILPPQASPAAPVGDAIPIPVVPARRRADSFTGGRPRLQSAGKVEFVRSHSPGSHDFLKSPAASPTNGGGGGKGGGGLLSHGHGRNGLHRRRVRSIKRSSEGGTTSRNSVASPASTPGGGSSPILSKSLGTAGHLAGVMSVDRSKIQAYRANNAALKMGGGGELEAKVNEGLKRSLPDADDRKEEEEEEGVRPPPPLPLTSGKTSRNVPEEKSRGIGALIEPPKPNRSTLDFDTRETRTGTPAEVEPPKPTAAPLAAAVVEPSPPLQPKPKPGKYVPPHLRKKGAGGGLKSGGGGKYIPPHLRNKGKRPPPPPPPCDDDDGTRTNGSEGANEKASPSGGDEAGTAKQSASAANGEAPKAGADRNEGDSNKAAGAHRHYNLGGCADPKATTGSILEPKYIPKRASKVGKFHTDGFGAVGGGGGGGRGGNGGGNSEEGDDDEPSKDRRLCWEVGAISQCGIRDSNEDSYLISNDLLGAFAAHKSSSSLSSEGGVSDSNAAEEANGSKDEKQQPDTQPGPEGEDRNKAVDDDEQRRHHGLFAIFDGHCGNHAARFAAEKLPFYLMEEYEALERRCSDYLVPAEQKARQILTTAIARLDEDFCHLCQADGREWDCGATALIVLVVGDALVVANVGDSRGVLCKSSSSLVPTVGDAISKRDEEDEEHVAHPEDISPNNGWEVLELDNLMYDSAHDDPAADSDPAPPVYFRSVTPVHSPARPDEKSRIEAANGWITTETEIPIKVQLQRMDFYDPDVVDILKRCFADRLKDHCHHGGHESNKRCSAAEPGRLLHISRICGELAVSRALGDRDFKAAFNSTSSGSDDDNDVDEEKDDDNGGDASDSALWECPFLLPYPDNHSRRFDGDLVSGVPEIRVMRVGGNGVREEFLLLACDGLWDVMDADDAVRVTKGLLFDKGWSAKKAAARLAELAIHLGSSDNVTVIVVRFYVEG